jgi:hypothetical protein
MIRARRGSITDLPTPFNRCGKPPSKSGTSHHHHLMTDRPVPAATTRWPLLNKQHSAHPRTDQAESLDVVEPAETTSPQADWRCMTHYGSTLHVRTAGPGLGSPKRLPRGFDRFYSTRVS